jgi:two-component system, chemotaxis family, CheB/CheR fusion protein
LWRPRAKSRASCLLADCAVRLNGKCVLLVEDATEIRVAVDVLLRVEGADVLAAASGREALALAACNSFQVLLTDLGLPDIPGDILIRQVLAAMWPRPRVVVVTGYGEPELSGAWAAGADAVFTKPVEWNALLRALGTPAAPIAA